MGNRQHYYVPTPVLLGFLLAASAWFITAGIWLERWVLEAQGVGPRIWIATTAAFLLSVISAIAGRGFFSDLATHRAEEKELAVTFWQALIVVAVMVGTGAFIVWTSSWMNQLQDVPRAK